MGVDLSVGLYLELTPWQPPRYLSVADEVGLAECLLPAGTSTPDQSRRGNEPFMANLEDARVARRTRRACAAIGPRHPERERGARSDCLYRDRHRQSSMFGQKRNSRSDCYRLHETPKVSILQPGAVGEVKATDKASCPGCVARARGRSPRPGHRGFPGRVREGGGRYRDGSDVGAAPCRVGQCPGCAT